MKQIPRTFRFYETYETASWLESAAADPSSFIEMPWEKNDFTNALGRYSKLSLLHHYIFHLMVVEKSREYRKNYYDRGAEDIDAFRDTFNEYNIDLKDETNFKPFGADYDEYEHFYL